MPDDTLPKNALPDDPPPDNSPGPDTRAFRVDDWLVEPRLYRLKKDDEVVDLEPKIMHVLVELARRPGELVERDTLLDEVWSGTVVTGHVLNRSISQLRKALGDDTDDPRYIETIPKAGYRLIAPVRRAEDPAFGGDGAVIRAGSVGFGGLPPGGPASTVRRLAPWFLDRRYVLTVAAGVLFLAVVSFLSLSEIGSVGREQPIPSIRPITSMPGNEVEPSFSPEGDRIAYAGTDAAGHLDIFVKLIDSGDPVRLTQTPATERGPAWSPDGTRIAYIRTGEEGCSIVVMPALGGAERTVAECGIRTHPGIEWTADGSGLLSAERSEVDLPFRLWHTSLETLERRALTDPPRFAFGDVHPAVSADGGTLAFVRGTSDWTKDIYRMPLDGSTPPARITSFKRDVRGIDWLDEDHLVFAANLSGQYGLWAISPTGTGLTPLASAGGWMIRNPAVADGSGRLAYEESSHDLDVWRMALSPADGQAPPEAFIQSSRWDLFPAYSPDGRSVAFVSTRSGSFELWFSDADGSDPRQMTEMDAAWLTTPLWSPDGRSILFGANLDGQLELFIFRLADHSVEQLTDNADHDLASAWSADGRSVYFASEQTGSWQIWKMSLEEGTARQLTNGGAYRALESKDGSTLYFHRISEGGLWSVPADGGNESLVQDDVDPRMWRAWTLDGDDLFYIAYVENQGNRLGATSLVSGESRVLYEFDPGPGSAGLTVSPDRNWILFTHSTQSESDLVLLENPRSGR